MDLGMVVKHRLKDLGLDQRGLAAAADVTESYISQLLAERKPPPARNRTDVYEKMERFLQLPVGELSKLAEIRRMEHLKKRVIEPPRPLFGDVRELVLRKCRNEKRDKIREIFAREPFGELERLVTQKLLDVVKGVASEEIGNQEWLSSVAQLGRLSPGQTRMMILDFLDKDVFHVSAENCLALMEPLIDSWDIDLATFGIEVVLNRALVPGYLKRFEFVEREAEPPFHVEQGLQEFLKNPQLSGSATGEEIEFLRLLRFRGRRPTPLYYYRELQNLRDPLHFHPAWTRDH